MATAIPSRKSHRPRREPIDYRAKALELGLHVDGLEDVAVRRAVGEEESRRFYEDNRESVDWWNRWVEENGLPLEKYRLF